SPVRQEFQEFREEVSQKVRATVQEELSPVRQEFQEFREEVSQELQALRHDVQDLKKGQAVIENTVNDLRSINRRTHKEVFSQLNAIWDDIKRLSTQEKSAIR
ncbi:MAG: hypothetical protein ACOY35_00785, partial [Bacillota bacterium]